MARVSAGDTISQTSQPSIFFKPTGLGTLAVTVWRPVKEEWRNSAIPGAGAGSEQGLEMG